MSGAAEDAPGGVDAGPDAETAGSGAPPLSHEHQTTVIARTVVRLVVPIILLTAVALLLQGHNQPGGGFIGAVLTATAFVLVYVVFGMEYLQSDLLRIDDNGDEHRAIEWYRWLFAGGLAIALASGLVPLLFGFPFLTQAVAMLEGLPLYGHMEVASAFTFDLGVYLAVVGGLLTVIGEVGGE